MRRLDQPLQIDRDVVARPPQLANGAAASVPLRIAATVDHEPAIDHRHEIENLAVLRADEPVDPRRRKRAAQRRRHRNRVDDVAQRAKPDEENAGSVQTRDR